MGNLLLALGVIVVLNLVTNFVAGISPVLAMLLYLGAFFLVFYYPVIKNCKKTNTNEKTQSQSYANPTKIDPNDIVDVTYSEKEVK